MSIHGGKLKQCKEISQVIYDISKNYDIKGYVEPFCGFISVFGQIYNYYGDKIKYKFGDINQSTIYMWKKAQRGWRPPTTCTKKEYEYYRNARDSAEKGYLCHQYAFQCQFCENFACDYGKKRDSSKASERVYLTGRKAKNAIFSHGNYKQFSKLKNYILYLDPPYSNSSQRYKTNQLFDNDEFWEWTRNMSKNNLVFISSYEAPKDFKCIWKKEHKLTGEQRNNKNKVRVEKLFIYFEINVEDDFNSLFKVLQDVLDES